MFYRMGRKHSCTFEYYLLITHLPIDEMHIKSNWWINVSDKTVNAWTEWMNVCMGDTQRKETKRNTKQFTMFHSMRHFSRFGILFFVALSQSVSHFGCLNILQILLFCDLTLQSNAENPMSNYTFFVVEKKKLNVEAHYSLKHVNYVQDE